MTIQKCASVAQPGDTCEVHTGTYRETVTPPRSGAPGAPIRFEAAPGECVVVSGANVLTGSWQAYSGNIYVTNTSASFIQLFAGGQMLNEARWPNADPSDLIHAPMDRAGQGTDQNGLVAPHAPPGDWTGAMVFLIPGQHWLSNTRQITAYDPASHRITFDHPVDASPAMLPDVNTRYYLFGSLLALDTPGEWFLDTNAHKLYLWAPGSVNPGSLQLEIKQRDWAFDVSNQSYIEIAGFQIFGAAVRLNGANNCVVDGIKARYVSHTRTTDGFSPFLTVPMVLGNNNIWKNSQIEYSAASGLALPLGNNNLVSNNIIHDIDYMATNSAGVDLLGWAPMMNDTVVYNTVARSGRGGIFLYGASASRVMFNKVHDVAQLTDDVGGIYTWGTDGGDTEIAYNEVYNVPCVYGTGIYLDDSALGFVVHHNSLHDLAWYGVIFKDRNAIFNNTAINTTVATADLQPNAGTGQWDDVDHAQVFNNLSDGTTGVQLAVGSSNVTDYGYHQRITGVKQAWQHVTIPFSSLAQPTWATPRSLDLAHVVTLGLVPLTPGDFQIEIDNVRLEGPTPRLLSDFEQGLTSSLGSSWGASSGASDTATLTAAAGGAGCSAQAALLAGTLTADGWASMGLFPAPGASWDFSAYTGISFDVRARGRFQPRASTHQAVFGLNYVCPLDANRVPTTSCAIDQAVPFPPFTNGFTGAGPDLGAYESALPTWTSGAQFAESWSSCTAPSDAAGSPPPGGAYPAIPAGSWPLQTPDVGWPDACATSCTGHTTQGSTRWQQFTANGLYLDVDTSGCGFSSTPLYFTSLGGNTMHWMTTGATSIYSPTPTGFRVYVYSTFGNVTPQDANSFGWYLDWRATPGNLRQSALCTGSTAPGATNWQQYSANGLYLDVDTSACGFSALPEYLTSLGGSTNHWTTTGATSIYIPTPTGFRVYVYSRYGPYTPQDANSFGWHLNWQATPTNLRQPSLCTGQTASGATNWQQYTANGLYLDVDTSSCGFSSLPEYFTSLGGNCCHWMTTGATSIYSPTPTGFRVYLYSNFGSVTPQQANSFGWKLNWSAVP